MIGISTSHFNPMAQMSFQWQTHGQQAAVEGKTCGSNMSFSFFSHIKCIPKPYPFYFLMSPFAFLIHIVISYLKDKCFMCIPQLLILALKRFFCTTSETTSSKPSESGHHEQKTSKYIVQGFPRSTHQLWLWTLRSAL